MIFGFFSDSDKEKPEFVPDEVLTEAMQLIVTSMDQQISLAREMSHSMPDGEARFSALLNGSFFYGYVFGLNERIAMEHFSTIVEKQNIGKNVHRLLLGVVANIFYPDTEPDWDAVLAWEAQAIAYGASQNDSYDEGMRAGKLLGEELLNDSNNLSVSLLSAELLKPWRSLIPNATR